jgi:hypothetical protein
VKKTPEMIAKQIDREMQRAARNWALYQHEHCALYERDLEQICPRKDQDRKKKLIRFAQQYGFRLRFYHEGLCAIFDKPAPPVEKYAGPLWPAVVSQA